MPRDIHISAESCEAGDDPEDNIHDSNYDDDEGTINSSEVDERVQGNVVPVVERRTYTSRRSAPNKSSFQEEDDPLTTPELSFNGKILLRKSASQYLIICIIDLQICLGEEFSAN